MAGVARPLALPRGWPRGLRSAAVHAVSIAEFALTTALGWADQSLNPRLRLRAELERLRNEVLLLREEIRIKDSRMQHIEAQKRPHYPPTARLAILELRAARGWSLAQAARIWHVDLTTVPTTLGFWTSWSPFALPQVWPFCWWVAVAVDHYSRRVMGFAVFPGQPSSAFVRRFLGRLFRNHQPQHLTSDRGSQFTAMEFKRWCHRRGVRQRFGAIGKYGSLAVIERCIRTIKNECTRRLILVPYRLAAMEQELAFYVSWYNGHRPHSRLGATPNELYHHRRLASRVPRFEPRPRWPRRSPCASPPTLIRGQPGVALHLAVRYHAGRRHLPTITLKRAA